MRSMRFMSLTVGFALLLTGGVQRLSGQTTLTLPGEDLPSVEFNETDLGTALDYLRTLGNEMLAKNGKSLNLVLIDPDGTLSQKRVTMKLTGAPWSTALKYTCELAGLIVEADYGTLVVGPKAAVQKLRLSRTKIRHSDGSAALAQRLGATPLTNIEFNGAHLGEIVEFLHAKTESQAGKSPQPPINFLIKENAAKPVADRPVTLKLARAPLAEVLHFATGLAGCRFRIDANAIVIGEDEDIKRVPRPQIANRGPVLQSLSGTRIPSVDISSGTSLGDLIELFRSYSRDPSTFPGGVNMIDSTGEKLETWTPVKLANVRLIDLIQYINESSGTIYRIEGNALILLKDPHVKERPGQSLAPASASGNAAGAPLRFDQ